MGLRQLWDQFRAGLRPSARHEFTLDDFMVEMVQVKKLGPMGKVMRMVPGMADLTQKVGLDEVDVERHMERMLAIYGSMTKAERRNVDLLNGSRRRRIGDGAGVRTIEVAQFARQFRMSRDMMRAVSSRG